MKPSLISFQIPLVFRPFAGSRRSAVVALGLLCAALSGCGGGSSEFQPRAVEITRFPGGTPWAYVEGSNDYVVRTDAQWQQVWTLHEPRLLPPPPRPSIDFAKTLVLGVHRGVASDGCRSLSIQSVTETASELRVDALLVESVAPGTACTTALVPLTDFVTVAASDKPVRFAVTQR